MIGKLIERQQPYLQTIILIFTWLLGNIWAYRWFVESLGDTPLNSLLLCFGAIAIVIRLISDNFWQKLQPPRLKLYPVLFVLGGELAAIALQWTLDLPQLILSCFILGSYGLLGLFIPSASWHKGLCVAVIVACVVPFLLAFNSGLGFPVRIITAHAVAQFLSDLRLGAVSSYDIIVMENGIAQVDLPCSGMKSLWTGTVFLLGATWLENRQLGFRWLLVAIANLLLLITANILRVLILVMAIEVWQQPQIADVLHLPLGIIGFIFASLLTWMLLQTVPRYSSSLPKASGDSTDRRSNLNWLVATVIILGIIGQFNPHHSDKTPAAINLPPEITTESLALSPAEANFFDNPANPLVQKSRFQFGSLSGSILLVGSNSWQAHHPPELCFVGNGFKVDRMESKPIDNLINARWLSLQNGSQSAIYWFQSSNATTDDFIWRIWERISHRQQTWVMVSVLFDSAENPNGTALKKFSHAVYQSVDRSFND